MSLIVTNPPVPPSPVGLYDSASIQFLPSGTGAITTETVQAALRRMVFSGQYSLTANFNTARDALTDTAAFKAIQIGSSAVNGGSTLTFPARTSGRGPSGIVVYDVTFSGTIDPNISIGYNLSADGTASQAGEPIAHLAFEGNYNDGSGQNKMELYFQWTGLPSQGASTYRPFFCQANRTTGTYQTRIAGDQISFTDNTGLNVVADFFPTYLRVGLEANYWKIQGAATLNAPTISAQGGDNNISLAYQSKGTGGHLFYTGAGARVALIVQNNANSVNYTTLLPGAAGVPAQISADGSDTDIDICLTPKGAGITRFNNATIALGAGAAPTLGTIGGSGPTVAGQNSWFKFKDSSGAAFWVPVWK